MSIVDILSGYIGGVIFALVILSPVRAYERGYDDASKIFKDYDRGFRAGIEAASKLFSYDKGFYDGWDCGWQRRDEYYALFERSEE